MGDALRATDIRDWAIAERDMAPHISTLTVYATECLRIVEFGTRGAVSTWAFLDGLPENGRLWSVDTQRCVVPPRVSQDPRWSFILGDDTSDEVMAKLPDQADLVFIDTTHEYEHTLLELEIAEILKPRWIVCHDAEWPGVDRAIKEFTAQGRWRMSSYREAHDQKGGFSLATLVSR